MTGSLLVVRRWLDFDALREKEGDERKDRGVVVVEGEAVVAIVVVGGRGGGVGR